MGDAKADFSKMRAQLEAHDAQREIVIKRARDITKQSKAAIYALQRDEVKEASQHLIEAEKAIGELSGLIAKDPSLRTGSFSAGLEEYVEAKALAYFLEKRALLPASAITQADAEEYLGGVCDLTGELVRYAVLKASKRDTKTVDDVKAVIELIMGEMMLFDLRNGDLRRKYDGIKYSLQKVEQLVYELSLHVSSEE